MLQLYVSEDAAKPLVSVFLVHGVGVSVMQVVCAPKVDLVALHIVALALLCTAALLPMDGVGQQPGAH